VNPSHPLSSEDDVAAAAAPTRVRAAGAVVLMAGAFGVLHVVQLLSAVTVRGGPFVAVPYLLGFEAVTAVVAGVGLARARAWAPWPSIATSGLLALTAAGWFFFAIINGLFTFFGMLEPALAGLALAFAVVAKAPCEQAAAARKRLERAGFDLGV
jgi:hypothetical protein